jgi:hypothetical protein
MTTENCICYYFEPIERNKLIKMVEFAYSHFDTCATRFGLNRDEGGTELWFLNPSEELKNKFNELKLRCSNCHERDNRGKPVPYQ